MIYDRIDKDEKFGLVIDISGFEDLTGAAIRADLKMESALMKELSHIPKVAFISGKNWLDVLIKGAGKIFSGTDLKAFAPDQIQAAVAFASDLPSTVKAHGAKVTEITTGRPDFLAFELSGKITDGVLHPLIDDLMAKLKTQDHIDLMVKIRDFHGFELALLKDGSLYEMKMLALKKVRRYAIVGASGWMAGIVKTVAPFFEMEIGTFALEEESEALAWLNS